jgi:two-component system, sensor histidine kinase YesM
MKLLFNPLKQTKIKFKLLMIFGIVIAYTLIVISVFGYGSYRNLMIEKSLSYSKKNSEELSMLLKDKIDTLNNFSLAILYDNRIYSLNRDLTTAEHDTIFQYRFGTDVDDYLRSILYSKNELLSVGFRFVGSNKTYVISRIYTMNADITSDIKNISAAGESGKGRPVWYVTNKEGVINIYISKIVYDINTLKEIGVLIFRINPDYIFDVLRDLSINTQHNIYIFDKTNHKLFEYKYFEPALRNFQSKLLQLKAAEGFKKIKTDNDEVYAITSTISLEKFKLIICISSKAMLKEVNNLSRFLFLLFLITIPILLILINYFQRDIIKPLNLLVSKMKKIENGEIGAKINLVRSDEIGYVFKTFNKMSQEIKVLIDSVYKEQLALKDEEIKALQAQINPHFLYNTLEAINWKARIHGVTDISDMVSALSYIMEANMNRNNEKLIFVKKEIEYINNYKFIIEKRFNDKLKFIIEVPKEIKEYKIPKLIILPIVENSVYHGLEMKKGEGTIHLEITLKENFLIIKVTDDGLGMDEKTLEKIKDNLDIDINDIEDIYDKPSPNIGLINVHKRLKLLYGNEYGVEISSVLNHGTTVIMRLPCILDSIS